MILPKAFAAWLSLDELCGRDCRPPAVPSRDKGAQKFPHAQRNKGVNNPLTRSRPRKAGEKTWECLMRKLVLGLVGASALAISSAASAVVILPGAPAVGDQSQGTTVFLTTPPQPIASTFVGPITAT